MFHFKFVYFNVFVIVARFIICGNCHEPLLSNIVGNMVSLLYMGCQSTLFKVGFVTFVTFVLLLRLDINICNYYQLFSEKKLVPQSHIYAIDGRLRALHMSKDTHLL